MSDTHVHIIEWRKTTTGAGYFLGGWRSENILEGFYPTFNTNYFSKSAEKALTYNTIISTLLHIFILGGIAFFAQPENKK